MSLTGALRPSPEYNDSGAPWLGEIPSHWECSTLRRAARIQLSNVDKHTIDGEVPVRLCNYTDVYRRRFLTCEGIKRLKVVLPSVDEQDRLVSWLKRDLADVEATIARIQHEMDLVGEYGTRLIADVVTGKLDVRGVELPTLDEAEPVDDALAGDEEAGEADLDAATEDAATAPEE